MLSTLRIQNIAIIENVEIDFDSGLNILTGETGAGKSIILKCINLICGKKASQDIIRTGCESGQIEAIFDLKKEQLDTIQASLNQINLEALSSILDEEIVIKRVINKKGRSKFYLNGSIFSQSNISQLMGLIVEASGQHDYQGLRSPTTYRDMLDSYGVSKDILSDVQEKFTAWREQNNKLIQLRTSKSAFLERFEALSAIKDLLEEADLQLGEKESLLEDLESTKDGEKIASELEQTREKLDGSHYSEDGALALVQSVSKSLGDSVFDSEQYSNLRTLSTEATTLLEELSSEISQTLQKLDRDPHALERVQNRLTQIKQLERRFGKDNDELVRYRDEILKELSQYDEASLDEGSLELQVEALKKKLVESEKVLTAERTKVASAVTKEVNKQLGALGLKKASFEITLNAGDSSIRGSDTVQFLFSANPGEPLRELDAVASGGELSRLQLILKAMSADSKNTAIQIFDEIDVGVGGQIAHLVGQRLKTISAHSQTIVITHAAQVAALADTHIYVEKHVSENRTYCKANSLGKDERVNAIAAMLAGKKVSKEFISSAKKLLQET